MDANHERTDDSQEEVKTQVASLVSCIKVNQEEMYTMLEASLEKMEFRTETSQEPRTAKIKTDLEEADTTDLETD
jgi:fructose-1-phosphate kinase PfkB-like protein